MRRFSFSILVLAAVLTSLTPRIAAQDLTVTLVAGEAQGYTEALAFSKDGRALREVRRVALENTGPYWRIRATTYDVATGALSHNLILQPYTIFFSATSDARVAIISVDTGQPGELAYPFLLDTVTGRTWNIPSDWFDPEDTRPIAAISGNGRLVSAYSELGPQDRPMVVSVYDWRTKRLVARQTSGYISAGGIFGGGVTEDGKIAFWNNRVGSEIVDPKSGRLIVNAGPNSYRSLDSAWIVEFPNPLYEAASPEVIIRDGRSGKLVGRLDLQMTDDNEKQNWACARAAFCGTSGRFIAATNDTVLVFQVPSGKKIADFPAESWIDPNAIKTNPAVTVACSLNGKRVAIRSGSRLTLHDLN